jgi:cytochrome c-type biogenesis protein CcmH/NrfF
MRRIAWPAGYAFLPVMTLLVSGLSLRSQTASSQSPLVADRVYETLLAPCCWRESLAVHRSDAAVALRREIVDMANAGMTANLIVERLVGRYGVRILREPPGQRAKWLYALPVIFSFLGALVVGRFVRRNLKEDPPVAGAAAG